MVLEVTDAAAPMMGTMGITDSMDASEMLDNDNDLENTNKDILINEYPVDPCF